MPKADSRGEKENRLLILRVFVPPGRREILIEKAPRLPYPSCMSTETEELIRICEALPVEKRAEVAEFARFLLARTSDQAWEATLADPVGHPRLDAFVQSALAEGSEPLDLDRL